MKLQNEYTPTLGILIVGSKEMSCLRLMNIYNCMLSICIDTLDVCHVISQGLNVIRLI